jgi:hypothetical protein
LDESIEEVKLDLKKGNKLTKVNLGYNQMVILNVLTQNKTFSPMFD